LFLNLPQSYIIYLTLGKKSDFYCNFIALIYNKLENKVIFFRKNIKKMPKKKKFFSENAKRRKSAPKNRQKFLKKVCAAKIL